MRSPVVDLHTRKAWARRSHVHFPLAQRWAVVTYKTGRTWRELIQDLIWLVHG
jgi:hypothetical protein